MFQSKLECVRNNYYNIQEFLKLENPTAFSVSKIMYVIINFHKTVVWSMCHEPY